MSGTDHQSGAGNSGANAAANKGITTHSTLNPNPYKFDNRLTEYFINSGLMTVEEYHEHLKNLPDDAGNATTLTLDGVQDSGSTEHH